MTTLQVVAAMDTDTRVQVETKILGLLVSMENVCVIMLWSQIKLQTTIEVICKTPGSLRIALASDFFTLMKYIFTCNEVYVKIIVRHHASEETGFHKRMIRTDSDSGFMQMASFCDLYTYSSMQQLQ